MGKRVVQVMVVYVGDLIMNWELGTLGMCGRGGGGGGLMSLEIAAPGLSDVVKVACVLVVEVVVDVDVAVMPNFLKRIFSSHSSQPCLGLFKLRC